MSISMTTGRGASDQVSVKAATAEIERNDGFLVLEGK
jgi:hypothetical protein